MPDLAKARTEQVEWSQMIPVSMSESIRKVVITLLLIVLSLIAYCTKCFSLAEDQTPSSDQHRPHDSSGGCSDISISEFRSLKQYEVGLGPKGQVYGYWSIKFRKGETLSDYGQLVFHWHHSDSSDEGTYRCKKGLLHVRVSGHTFFAKYDRQTRILNWEGIEYKKIK
jgi:hypothetical protein